MQNQLRKLLQVLGALAVAALAWQITRTGQLEGTLFGVPYDVRPPTVERLRQRLWNPSDHHIFTPHVFGWGYSVNFYELGRRLGLIAGR